MSSTRQYELVYIALPDSTEEVLADLHQSPTTSSIASCSAARTPPRSSAARPRAV